MAKTNILKLTLSVILLSYNCIHQANAQSIQNQFETVVNGSNNYQEYKVIKQSQIKNLWQNTVDTIKQKDLKYNQLQSKLAEQTATLKSNEALLANKEKSLQESINNVNEISLLGLFKIEKGNYKIIMWTAIAVLAGLSAVLYFITLTARKESKYRIKLFDEIQEEFKNFKAKANENEKKLARALQDERNKLEEYNIR